MNKMLKIRDVTLRDGQQSHFATRMTQAQIDRVLPFYREAGFYAIEVWGGAVPDSIMRYLNEDPWVRLETIKAAIGDKTKLTALSRGRNLFGYNPYPEAVIEGFNRNAIQSGIDIMRIFDALNDTANIESTIKHVKENGGIADCAVCYTVDPKPRKTERLLEILKGNVIHKKVFTIEYFVRKAQELERMGADMITIKDMAGLIPPIKTGILVKLLKEEVNIPVNFHTHSTPGYGLASTLSAIINGVDIVDTCILNFSGGPAGPSFEIIQIFCNKLKIKTGVNLKAVASINRELAPIRKELAAFDTCQEMPLDFDISSGSLPKKIDQLFDDAIQYAQKRKEKELLKVTQQIEGYFKLPPPNAKVRSAEMPGGMYTNMLAQLKQLNLEELLPRVLEIIPTIRLNSGCPPLVTPTSQIVGQQAVNCVLDENSGKPMYTTKSVQFENMVRGLYGKTPIAIDPKFRKKITGSANEVPYNPNDHRRVENDFCEAQGVKLAENEKEELLLELFPAVAKTFLSNRLEQRNLEQIRAIKEEERRAYEAERAKWNNMTNEDKLKQIQEGLLNYKWRTEK